MKQFVIKNHLNAYQWAKEAYPGLDEKVIVRAIYRKEGD